MSVSMPATVHRYSASDLIQRFGLSCVAQAPAPSNILPFALPEWAATGPAAASAHFPSESLAAGLEPNLDEIRSAASAIPPSAIAAEPDWMKVARSFAHEAA